MVFMSLSSRATAAHIHSYPLRVKTSINLGSFQSFFTLVVFVGMIDNFPFNVA